MREGAKVPKITNKPFWTTSKQERRTRNRVLLWGVAAWFALMLVAAITNEIAHPGSFSESMAKSEAERAKKYPYGGLTTEQAAQIIDDCNKHPDALRCQ